jgi:ribonuclease HI
MSQLLSRGGGKVMQIFCDGLCEPRNPGGYGCWGFVVSIDEQEVHSAYGSLGQASDMTNNKAEYEAVLQALRWFYKHGSAGVPVSPRLYTDSMLVVKQTSGEWACNKSFLRERRDRVRTGLTLCQATLSWVPREQNTRADALSREGYRAALASHRMQEKGATAL